MAPTVYYSIHFGHDTHLIGRVVWVSSSIYEVQKCDHQLYELAEALITLLSSLQLALLAYSKLTHSIYQVLALPKPSVMY